MQRREGLPPPLLAIDVRARSDEHAHEILVARAYGKVQWCAAVPGRHVDVGFAEGVGEELVEEAGGLVSYR